MRSATWACWPPTHRRSSKAPRVSRAVRARATFCSFSAPAMSIGPSTCFDASVARVEENVPLARHTTIGTGGPARWFTRPASIEELQDALRWAKEGDVSVETIGLGSNVLAHDDGIEALVVKLDGDLVAAEIQGDVLVAGGGAANAVALH